MDRFAEAAERVDPVEILAALGLPADLADAADDERLGRRDHRRERRGVPPHRPDVGTPIISYDPPTGNSLFGPVISSVPDRRRDRPGDVRRAAHVRRLSRLLRAQADDAPAHRSPPAVRFTSTSLPAE